MSTHCRLHYIADTNFKVTKLLDLQEKIWQII